MKNFADSDLMKKLHMIATIKANGHPALNESWEEMNARLKAEDEELQRQRFEKQFREGKMKNAIGRSGLQGKHLNCNFNNYQVTNAGQQKALNFAKKYTEGFGKQPRINFVFFGASRTGKNHLSAAICNDLIAKGVSCLVITVTELSMKVKSSYRKDSQYSEESILKDICNYDLLILDEIGISHNSDNVKVMLNYIIDQRSINQKATGILSNLGSSRIREELGDRAVNRVMEVGSAIKFDWDGYEFDFGDTDEL